MRHKERNTERHTVRVRETDKQRVRQTERQKTDSFLGAGHQDFYGLTKVFVCLNCSTTASDCL